MDPVLLEIDKRGVAYVTLNRPEVNNAYNGDMIAALLEGMETLSEDPAVRLIVVKGAGKHFQAGADLTWLEQVRTASPEQNLEVSKRTTAAVRRLDECPKPTIALVHGACFGGGTGIVAACDMVIAADNAMFSIAEVRWGLHAGPIIPQLAEAIGPRQLRRFALSGERFDARHAETIGLVHQVCAPDDLSAAGERLIAAVLTNGPEAVAETKTLIRRYGFAPITDRSADALAESHAEKRQSEEAAEGLKSFLEKRPASWQPQQE